MAQKKELRYLDEQKNELVGPFTRDELDELHRNGVIDDYTHIFDPQSLRQPNGPMGPQGITYMFLARNDVDFSPSADEFHASRACKPITVLSGPNNGGKTLLLKHLFSIVEHDGYLVACNRYSHVDVLNTRKLEENEYRRYFDNFMHNFRSSSQNGEDNELKLEQVVTVLKNADRARLFALCEELLGNKFSLERTDPENEFSPYYVSMDGENLRYGSSGTRLLMTLLGILLDRRFKVLLLDEPEIGLSPRIQSRLARFVYDADARAEFCPHVRQIYIATHSHIFLDRSTYSNNFVVQKQGKLVTVEPVGSVGDLHRLQFNMLGNELESLFLPAAIVIVEGESDITYLTRALELHLPGPHVAMVAPTGRAR